ncbi:MAG: hypothetical protein WCT10_04220 [Patescibacteria group bacterium]|jgi:hypothetical protein
MIADTADQAQLRVSLLAALAYFDLFDYPLTLLELRRWRFGGPVAAPELDDIREVLAGAPVGEASGYYFLAGREEIVPSRQRRYRLAESKYRLAVRFARWTRLLPSIRLVAVCNSLAFSNADEASDIDLFLICRPGTLWITRLIVAGLLQLFGLRPEPGREADRFCLSFIISEDRLDLSGLALPGGDPYLLYWTATLMPLYDAGGVMERLWNANAWVRTSLPGAVPNPQADRRSVPVVAGTGWLLPLLRRLDGFAKRWQTRRFPAAIRELANTDSRVVVADDILKFHVDDRRADYERRFRERRAEVLKQL